MRCQKVLPEPTTAAIHAAGTPQRPSADSANPGVKPASTSAPTVTAMLASIADEAASDSVHQATSRSASRWASVRSSSGSVMRRAALR